MGLRCRKRMQSLHYKYEISDRSSSGSFGSRKLVPVELTRYHSSDRWRSGLGDPPASSRHQAMEMLSASADSLWSIDSEGSVGRHICRAEISMRSAVKLRRSLRLRKD